MQIVNVMFNTLYYFGYRYKRSYGLPRNQLLGKLVVLYETRFNTARVNWLFRLIGD